MSRGAHFDNDGQVSVKTVPASLPGKKDNRTINCGDGRSCNQGLEVSVIS